MMINPLLGLFAPRRTRARPVANLRASGGVGGLKTGEYVEFLFCPTPVVGTRLAVKGRSGGLPGGHMDDTGGSFEAPMAFIGDSPRSFLVLYCSFVDGIDRGIQVPLLYTLKTNFHLSQIAASAVIGVSLSPWLTKPVLALITDSIPIGGLRRRPYILGSAAVNATALSLIAYASFHHIGGWMLPMVLLTLRTFGRAMIDAAAQGLLLEDCRGPTGDENDQSKTSVLVSRFQAAHRLGQFINVVASGYVMATSSLEPIYMTMAAVHVGTMLLAWSTPEDPVTTPPSDLSLVDQITTTIPEKFTELKTVVGNTPAFANVLEYAFLSVVVPSYEAPMTYYLLDARHFSPANISIVNIIQTTGSLIAPVVYSTFFQRTKYSSVMLGLTVASIPASLMPIIISSGLATAWGFNEVVYASVSAFTLTLINDLQMMPAHVLVAQLAPKGFEGTSLSLLTVVEGTGRVVSNVVSATMPYGLGAVAPQYKNMSLYIVLCTVFNVGPIGAIEGFDDIGRAKPSSVTIEEELEENEPVPTLGAVLKDLQQNGAASPLSIDSDASPVSQVSIRRD